MSDWIKIMKILSINPKKNTISHLRRYARDEDGSHTIEAVIWLPIFVIILALIINISVIYNRQAQIIRIVQDANRSYSVGRLTSTNEVRNAVLLAISGVAPNAVATSTETSGVITTRVDIPTTDLMPVDMFKILRSKTVTVTAQQYAEF